MSHLFYKKKKLQLIWFGNQPAEKQIPQCWPHLIANNCKIASALLIIAILASRIFCLGDKKKQNRMSLPI